jgi:hypothetical protein
VLAKGARSVIIVTSPLYGDDFICIHHSSAPRSQEGNAHYDLMVLGLFAPNNGLAEEVC